VKVEPAGWQAGVECSTLRNKRFHFFTQTLVEYKAKPMGLDPMSFS